MKKSTLILGVLLLGSIAFGQHGSHGAEGCDCPSCLEKAASGKTFTLPGLQGLEPADEHAECDHDHAAEEASHDDHAGHDHAAEAVGHDDHEGHDDHAGHDHGGEAEGVVLTDELIQHVGIQIQEAEGGVIAQSTLFPAEIKLNRDAMAAVSPRYASMVRQVFVEIGDAVRKGDLLASLENRETMAVYTVAAPLDGVIISKNLAVGETAGDDKVLFEVADLSSVWADISIFPKYQHLLRKDMLVKFIAHDGHTANGTIEYISPIVSHETRTFTARCVLEGASEDFTPGAFVRARVSFGSAERPVIVPREAVQTLEGEQVLFIPSDHGFETQVVELGVADEHFVEITSGLELGASYVATGAFALKAQMLTSGMDPHAGHGH